MKPGRVEILLLAVTLAFSVVILVWRLETYKDTLSFPKSMRDAGTLLNERPSANAIRLEPFDEAKALRLCEDQSRHDKDPARNASGLQSMVELCMRLQPIAYQKLQKTLERIGGYSWGKVLFETTLADDSRLGSVDYYWLAFSLGMDEAVFGDIRTEFAKGDLTLLQMQHGLDREARRLREATDKRSLFLTDVYYFAHHPAE